MKQAGSPKAKKAKHPMAGLKWLFTVPCEICGKPTIYHSAWVRVGVPPVHSGPCEEEWLAKQTT